MEYKEKYENYSNTEIGNMINSLYSRLPKESAW